MCGEDDDGRFGWLVPYSPLTGQDGHLLDVYLPGRINIERMRDAIQADRKKRNRGLQPGGREQERVIKIVQALADNAVAHVEASGGDYSFMDDGRRAWGIIDPTGELTQSIKDRQRSRYLRRVQAELIRRGKKL